MNLKANIASAMIILLSLGTLITVGLLPLGPLGMQGFVMLASMMLAVLNIVAVVLTILDENAITGAIFMTFIWIDLCVIVLIYNLFFKTVSPMEITNTMPLPFAILYFISGFTLYKYGKENDLLIEWGE